MLWLRRRSHRSLDSHRMEQMENPGKHVALPRDLELIHIKKAVAYVEKETAELVDLYLEQANVFSGIVGIFGVKALHAVSPYKKHKHPDVAQQ